MSRWIGSGCAVAAVLALGACKKDDAGTPSAPASTTEQDALWELAPRGAKLGLVTSGRALAMVEGAWLAIRDLIAVAPELADADRTLVRELETNLGTSEPRLADLGLTSDKGFAMFVVSEDDVVLIIPVADRDKFLAKVKGKKGADGDRIKSMTCREVGARYACATVPKLLDGLGQGKLPRSIDAAGARGDLEVAGVVPTKRGDGPALAIAGQLGRGALVLRGVVEGLPDKLTDMLGKPVKPRADRHSAGFAAFDARPLLENLVGRGAAIGKVKITDLIEAIGGPITITMPAGDLAIDLRVPLADTEPFERLVTRCDAIPALRRLGAKADDDGCQIEIPKVGLEVEAWVADKELRIGRRKAKGGASVPMSALGEEIADGEWTFALFGRGTAVAFDNAKFLDSLRDNAPKEALIGLRSMLMLNEMGLAGRVKGDKLTFLAGFRTAWDNPDEVVKKLAKIHLEDILDGRGPKVAKELASSYPDSPFAKDYAAGNGGVLAMTAPTGILAAVAIPAFLGSMKKTRKSESAIQLAKIAAAAKEHHATYGSFPVGEVAMTPSEPCCMGPRHRCPVAAAPWEDKTWRALSFAMDEPHFFQYAYRSDGRTFTATATGDLDCDLITVEWKMTGSIDAGQVLTKLEEPPPNSD